MFFLASDMQCMRPHRPMFQWTGDATDGVTAWFVGKQVELYQDIDRRLAQVEYLAGEISIADFALFPMFNRRRDMIRDNGLAHVARWGAALDARPALQEGRRALQ